MTDSGFVAGTLVHTDKGLVPIQDLKIGDRVLSAPEDATPLLDGKLETAYKPITKVFKSDEKQGVIAPLGNPSIICTANHPFWTKQKGWVKAVNLDYSTYIYQLTPLFDNPHYSHNSFVLGSMHGENQEFLSETPFEGVVIGVENNDYFESALLNSQTGKAVTQITGLTPTDSLLNIQADGRKYISTGV